MSGLNDGPQPFRGEPVRSGLCDRLLSHTVDAHLSHLSTSHPAMK